MLLCSLRPGVRFVGSRQRFARTHETFALGAGCPDQIRCPGGSTAGRPPLRLGFSIEWLQLRSGTRSAPVIQQASRQFTLVFNSD